MGFLHIPCRGWAAFRAKTAVHTQIFVLDHGAARLLERFGYIKRLLFVRRRHRQPGTYGVLALAWLERQYAKNLFKI